MGKKDKSHGGKANPYKPKKEMDSNAKIRMFHAKERNKHGLKLPCTGIKPTDARRRMCEAVQKYSEMLPDDETVMCIIIPEHGSGKARMAGSFAIEEGIAALEALDSVVPGRKKLENLLASFRRNKAAMDEQVSEDHESERGAADAERAAAQQQTAVEGDSQ